MNFLKKSHLALGIVLCAVIGIMANVYPGKSSSALEETTQDVGSLDRTFSDQQSQSARGLHNRFLATRKSI